MKLRSLVFACAVGAGVPVLAWSQNQPQTSGPDQRPGRTPSSDAGSDQPADRARSGTAGDAQVRAGSTPASARRTTSAATSTITGLGGIHRLPPEELQQRVTASSLIGKEIVDRDGKVVGTIKDVGLSNVLPLHLQSTTDRQTDARMRAPGVTPPDATKTTRAESNPMAGTNPMQPGGTQEVNLLVEVRGEMGTEEDLLVIPASQVWQVEGNGEQYRLAMSDAELKNAADLGRPGTAPAE